MEWISVNEKLPEENRRVLCCGKQGGMWIGYVVGKVWYAPNQRGFRSPVAWMELPERYKDGK